MYLSVSCYYSGLTFLESGDLKEARNLLEKSLKTARKHGEKCQEGRTLAEIGGVIGKIESDQKKIAKAIEYIDKGIKLLRELGTKPFLARGYLILGEHYLRVNNTEMAIENLKKAHTMFQEMEMDFWSNKTQTTLSEAENFSG